MSLIEPVRWVSRTGSRPPWIENAPASVLRRSLNVRPVVLSRRATALSRLTRVATTVRASRLSELGESPMRRVSNASVACRVRRSVIVAFLVFGQPLGKASCPTSELGIGGARLRPAIGKIEAKGGLAAAIGGDFRVDLFDRVAASREGLPA